MAQRIADSGSSYLDSLAHDLVDWWPYGDEAFAHARSVDRPILLSIGYASCHWCHVMSAESFQNLEIATYINDHFVAIKVDRQQHPDVDYAYLQATLALTGSSGWPLTCFCTPDGEPFFAGTYFPPEERGGLTPLPQVLEAMANAWANRQGDVIANANQIRAYLQVREAAAVQAPNMTDVVAKIAGDYDLIHGGFGGAPKFPNATLLDALLVKGDQRSIDMAMLSLEMMSRGAIHDQVGGGFHRYCVDAAWTIPHFEKLLADNALLLGVYVRAWRRTPDHDPVRRGLFERTIYALVEFLNRELSTESGAFIAGLDADSCDIRGAVHEGIYYMWNHELLIDALGAEDANWASHTFHVTTDGTFADGLSTLQLRGAIDHAKLDEVAQRLLEVRNERFRPAADELVVASWNAWAIESLVWGAMVFNDPAWMERARVAADYLWRVHVSPTGIARASLDGQPSTEGTLEDYGSVAGAFALLAGALGEDVWLDRALMLCEQARSFFHTDQGFSDSRREPLGGVRARSESGAPLPLSTMIEALRRVGAMAERDDLIELAEAAAASLNEVVEDSPRFVGAAVADLAISDEAIHGLARGVAVVVTDDPFDELARATWRLAPAGTSIISGRGGFGTHFDQRLDRGVYVCRNRRCFDRVDDYASLKDPLWARI